MNTSETPVKSMVSEDLINKTHSGKGFQGMTF